MPIPGGAPGQTGTDERPEEIPEQAAATRRLQQQLEEHVRVLTFLLQLEWQADSTLDTGRLLARMVELARRATEAAAGGIVLFGEGNRVQLITSRRKDRAGEAVAASLRQILGRTLSSWTAQRWAVLSVPDTLEDPSWTTLPGVSESRCVVAVPLRQEGRLWGLLALTHGLPGHFDHSHLQLLRAAASRIAAVLARAQRYPRVTRDPTRLAAIVANLTEPLFALDAEGVVILSNPPLARLVGRPSTALLGHAYRQVIDLQHASQPEAIEQVLRGRYASFNLDMVLRDAAGEQIPVRVGCGAIPGEQGRPEGAVVVLRDIRYLKEVEGLREDLSNMLVHDLKGPLASIGSTIQLLQHYPPDRIGEATLQELLSIADQGVRRLSRMIEAVLDVQHMEAGQFPLTEKPLELAGLAFQVLAEVGPLAAAAEIETRIDLPGDLPLVSGDGAVLARVLWNLLDNALKYTPRGGLVRISAREAVVPEEADPAGMPDDLPAGRWVVVEVADSGVGIPKEDRERIFGKFAQGRRGPLRRRGVGLGLAFCRLAIEAHGGQIWVGGGELAGSVFSFTLPVAG